MNINPSYSASPKFVGFYEVQNLRVFCELREREFLVKTQYFSSVVERPACYLSDYEWVHEDFIHLKKRRQVAVAFSKVLDPN